MPNEQAWAGFLGYLSIAFWLCAQVPQVVKNAKLQSCDGLALPFLVNWLFGDITNFIGCVLTDQLPFQTYLAGYFCVIDFTLCYQFFYYRRFTPPQVAHTPAAASAPTLHSSLILPPRSTSRPGTTRTRTVSSPAVQPLSSALPPSAHPHTATSTRSHSTVRPKTRRNMGTHGSSSTVDSIGIYTDGSYAALYEAALDVARAAERVSARRSESRRRQLSRRSTTEDEATGEGMVESFHSDMSRRTSSTTNVDDYRRMALSTGDLLDGRGSRGRSVKRIGADTPVANGETDDQATPLAASSTHHATHRGQHQHPAEGETSARAKSRSLSLARNTSGRGGRRAAGVAFMSLGLLLRLGGPSIMSSASGAQRDGRVLTPTMTTETIRDATAYSAWRHPPIHPISSYETTLDLGYTYFLATDKSHEPIPDDPPSYDRILGRISAWCCTTLYLTSRLPQIWKNFNRKSVEGLSILLFLFAFCGNLAYVMSILINPSGTSDPSNAGHYLLEALPYLLGSGGTLIFDMTIMIQSWMYGSAPPLPFAPHRKLRLPGRRRWRHVEDARMGSASLERTPLLAGVPTVPAPSRDRSLSPDVQIRFTPASVPNE